jgi:hypothetical protein
MFLACEKGISTDVSQVLDAAALLQITEFRLFELAYQLWYGRDASEKSIEQYFVPYMFRAVVPFWVRQLCRRILEADAKGELDPVQFGLEPCKPTTPVDGPAYYARLFLVGGAIVAMLGIACSLYLT